MTSTTSEQVSDTSDLLLGSEAPGPGFFAVRNNSLLGRTRAACWLALQDVKLVFNTIFRMLALIWSWIVDIFRLFTFVYIFGVPVPVILIYILILAVWYSAGIFWPFILRFTIEYLTPFINILIEVFNFSFEITLIILRIVIQIWNMFVPFIGMILYVVVDLVTTVMKMVFDILGAIDFESIIQAIMEIIFFLVDIIMKIIMVFVQVQLTQLQILVEVITPIMEILMDFVEILFPILSWILEFLFFVLEPILELVAAIAEIFSWMVSSSAAASSFAARSLLSVSADVLGTTLGLSMAHDARGAYVPFDAGPAKEMPPYHFEDGGGEYWDARSMYSWYKMQRASQEDAVRRSARDDDYRTFIRSAAEEDPEIADEAKRIRIAAGERRSRADRPGRETGRKPLQYDDHGGAYAGGDGEDDISHTVTHALYKGFSKHIKANNYDLRTMRELMDEILDHKRSKRDRLSGEAILNRYRAREPQHFLHSRGPSHVSFRQPPQHPSELHEQLKAERDQYEHQQRSSFSAGGNARRSRYGGGGSRSLLDSDGGNSWDSSERGRRGKDRKLDEMKKRHARMLIEQERRFTDYHEKHARATHLVFDTARQSLLKHGQSTLSYDTISYHWNRLLERNGYRSAWDVFQEFVDTHRDAKQFVENVRWFRDLSSSSDLLHHLGYDYDPAEHAHSSPHSSFKGWSHPRPGGRRLMQQNNADRDVSPDAEQQQSKEGNRGFEIITKTDCFSDPRNPLCLPVIPESFSWSVPKLVWPSNLTEATACAPWRDSACLYCLDRLHNGFQSLRFFLSGYLIPLNFLLTSFTLAVPWLSWTVDWIFLVPKGEIGGIIDFVCFFQHLYDLAIFLLTIAFFFRVVLPFLHVFVVRPLLTCRRIAFSARQLGDDSEYNELQRQRVDRFFALLTRYARQRAFFGQDWRAGPLRRPEYGPLYQREGVPRDGEGDGSEVELLEDEGERAGSRIGASLARDEDPHDRLVRRFVSVSGDLASHRTQAELCKIRLLALLAKIDSDEFQFATPAQREALRAQLLGSAGLPSEIVVQQTGEDAEDGYGPASSSLSLDSQPQPRSTDLSPYGVGRR